MRITNVFSDLLKTGLAVITLISEENCWQGFLHIVFLCLANYKNGRFTVILKCIRWDKKSGYFFIFAKYIYIHNGSCWILCCMSYLCNLT